MLMRKNRATNSIDLPMNWTIIIVLLPQLLIANDLIGLFETGNQLGILGRLLSGTSDAVGMVK